MIMEQKERQGSKRLRLNKEIIKNHWLFIGALGAMFVIVCILTALTPYIDDDFKYSCVLSYGGQLGNLNDLVTSQRVASFADIVASMCTHWLYWGGRVMAHSLVQLFLWLPKGVFNVVNAGMYLWLILSLYRLSGCRFETKEGSLTVLLGVMAAVWMGAPAFGSTVFWLTGSCNYLWGVAFVLAWLLPFKQQLETPTQRSWKYGIAMTVYSIFVGGYSENTSAAALMCVGLLMLYMLYEKKKWQWWMFTSVVSGFLGWLFLILAPGNSVRSVNLEVGWSTLGKYYNRILTAIKVLQVNLVVWVALFVVLLLIACYLKIERKQIHISLCFLLTACACDFAMILSPTYPSRASFSTFVFLLLACAVLFQNIRVEWFSLLSRCVVGVAVVFALSNCILASEAILQCYTLDHERMASLYQATADGQTEIESFDIVSDNDKSVFSYDVGWEYIMLTEFSAYYNLGEISVVECVSYGG